MSDRNITASLAAMTVNGKPDSELRYLTNLERQAEKTIKDAGGEVGKTVMPIKKRDNESDVQNREKLTTNVYGIAMKENVLVYRFQVAVNVFIARQSGTEVSIDLLTKPTKDAILIERRDLRRDIFKEFQNMTDCPFSGSRCVYYDLESILFSLDPVVLSKAEYDVPVKVLPSTFSHASRCVIQIRPVCNGTVLKLDDTSGLTLELSEVYKTLAQFLDIATGQPAMFDRDNHVSFTAGQSYLLQPDKNGFNVDDVAIFENETAYLAIGCQKSVHFIEGPGNRDNACSASLVIQTSKTPFHMDGSLYEKAVRIMPKLRNIREDDRIRLEKMLKGLVLETQHGERRQIFTIDGISKDTARTKQIPVNGHSLSIEQYFKQTYGYVLSEPNIPLIEVGRSKDKIRYFPMEICKVADNQRVKVHEMSPRMSQVVIRKCAVPPATLLEQNAKTAKSLNLWNNTSLSLAGISVTTRPVDLNGRVLTPPKIRFQNGAVNARPSDCTWQGSKFINPCKIGRWAAFAFLDERDKSKLRMQDFEEFLKRFVDESRLRGMQIEPRSFMPNILDNKTSEIEKTFAAALNKGVLYILAIHPEGAAGDLPHADIKYFERQYGVVTQCVALPTLLNVVQRNQRLTLQNIVNKTNIKFGGLNYNLAPDTPRVKEVLRDDTLYIGFGSNHPVSGLSRPSNNNNADNLNGQSERGPPTVVGYSANIGPNGAFDFAGDFAFQEPNRNENINVISDIVTSCAEMFKKRRGHMPKRVIIYRGGCSDGEFQMILKYEIPVIKLALYAMECEPTITVLAVNKLQNIRFFKQDINRNARAGDQNIQPGTVVDHTVTHPLFAEFYLNSHRAIQGTARTPKYTVLYDDNNMNMSQLEEISFLLCFSHQIVFLPTSVPSPVYIADCYAKRGRALYQRWTAQKGEQADYKQLTNALCYASGKVFPALLKSSGTMPKNEEEESSASNSNPSVSQKPKPKYERLNKLVAVSTKAPWLCKHKIVTLVRNAERVDRVFPEWLSENINDAGMYQPDDLNLPVVLWARPDGYRCYMDDCPVTEIGACVSQLVGRGLRKSPLMPIQRFYCSPAFRSVQTALEMSKGLGGIVEICIEPALFDFLGWYKKMPSLLSTADFLRLEMNINPEYVEKKSMKELQSLVGKETIDGFYARISKTIREIVKREHKVSHFVIITHAPGVDAAIKALKNCAPTAITENDLLHMGTYYPYSSTVTLANNGDDWSFVHDPFPSFSYLGTTNRVNSKFVERTISKGGAIPVESQESKK